MASLTLKWLSNIYVKGSTSIRDRFLKSIDIDIYNKFLDMYKEYTSIQSLKKITLYNKRRIHSTFIPYLTYYNKYREMFIKNMWETILRNEIGIDDTIVTYQQNTDSAVNLMLHLLLSPGWTNDRYLEVAELLKTIESYGVSINKESYSLFTFLMSNNVDPTDFPFLMVQDYLSSYYTMNMYMNNIFAFPLYTFIDSVSTITITDNTNYYNLIQSNIISKFKTNLYEDSYRNWLVCKFITSLFIPVINEYIRNNIETPWIVIDGVKYAVYNVLLKISDDIINSNPSSTRNYIDSYNIQTLLESYYQDFYNLVPFETKCFDKSRITDFYNDVLTNSDDNDHIDPSLFVILKSVCETTDTTSFDGFILYNIFNLIFQLSSFDKVDLDSYVSSIYTNGLDVYQPNFTFLSNLIKNEILSYIDTKLDHDYDNAQLSDIFFTTCNVIYKMILENISEYDILVDPLIDELIQNYNFQSVDSFKSTVTSRINALIYSQSGIIINNIATKMFSIRDNIDSSQIVNACSDLRDGNPTTFTNLVKQIVTELLTYVNTFYNVSVLKDKIYQIINNALYEYALDNKLKFDLLSNNIRYFNQYDTFFGYYESTCNNKINFLLQKYVAQIEHISIADLFRFLTNIDKLYYMIYPLNKDNYVNVYRLKRLHFLLLQTFDYNKYLSLNITDNPVTLKSLYKFLYNDILRNIIDEDDFRYIYQSTLMG